MKKLFTLLSFAAAMLAPLGAYADVTYHEPTKSIVFDSATSTTSAAQFHNLIQQHQPTTVYLSGPGGDAYAGLYMGRLIKEHQLRVVVPEGKRCVSACAMSAMATPQLLNDGEMLFHRAYLPYVPTTVSIDKINQEVGKWNFEFVKYLIEIGYPLEFGRALNNLTSPCVFLVYDDVTTYKGEPLDFAWPVDGYTTMDMCTDA